MTKFFPPFKIQVRWILVFFLLTLFDVGMGFEGKRQTTKIKVVTSVFPLKEFAQAVCGERGEVILLLPPGAEIHTWRPRPSDIIRIAKSDVFMHVSQDLEPWVDDILRGVDNPNLHTLRAIDSVLPAERVEYKDPLHEHQHDEDAGKHTHGTVDPHVWLDFTIDQRIIDTIVELFSQIEPEYGELFKRNGLVYKKKLEACDHRYRKELGRCKNRIIVLGGHAAFGYLAQRYRLQQVSLYGISPDSRPTPKQLVRVVELAKEYQVNVIYFETYVSDDLAKVIAEEIGAKTLVLDPAANLTVEKAKTNITFLEIMDQNLVSLKKGLSCD